MQHSYQNLFSFFITSYHTEQMSNLKARSIEKQLIHLARNSTFDT